MTELHSSRVRVLATGLALVACGDGGTPPAAIEQAIAAGEIDSSNNAVVAISLRSDPTSLCSGVLLDSTLVATARHCIASASRQVDCTQDSFGETAPADDVLVAQDTVLVDQSKWWRVREVLLPEADEVCGADIALLVMDAAMPGRPLPPRISASARHRETYSALGFGLTELGNGAGVRRVRTGLRVSCVSDHCGQSVASNEFQGEGALCWGDSGGPAVDSDGLAIGIATRGGPACSTPVYVDLSSWGELLRRGAEASADIHRSPLAEWATHPIPGAGGSGNEPDPSHVAGSAGLPTGKPPAPAEALPKTCSINQQQAPSSAGWLLGLLATCPLSYRRWRRCRRLHRQREPWRSGPRCGGDTRGPSPTARETLPRLAAMPD